MSLCLIMDVRIPLWMQIKKYTYSQGCTHNIDVSLNVHNLLKGHCHKKGQASNILFKCSFDRCLWGLCSGLCLSWAGVKMSAPRPMLDRWRILWRSYGDLKAAPSQIVNILSNHNKWQWIVNKRDILNKLCLSSYFLGHLAIQWVKSSIQLQT